MERSVELDEALRRGQAEGFREPGDSRSANCVAGLVGCDLQELCTAGSLTRFSGREVYTFERDNMDRTGFDMFMAELTFVYPVDLSADLLIYKPLGLESFMAHAYVAEYDSERDTLTLISSEPLAELLPHHASRFRASVSALDTILDEYDAPPIDGMNYAGSIMFAIIPQGNGASFAVNPDVAPPIPGSKTTFA